MKKNNKKILLAIVSIVLILGLGTVICLNIKDKEETNVIGENESQENSVVSDGEEIILYKNIDADLAVNYSDIKNLVNESEIIAIATIESAEGRNYNPVRKEYVPVYTTGTLKIEEIIQNKSNVLISQNQGLEYVRLGGKIKLSEYLKGIRETEKNKIVRNLSEKTKMTEEQMAEKLVKDNFIGDIEIEKDKKYLVFLKYTKDYGKYNIVGFEYGLREYDSHNKTIKNNKTNEFESKTQITNSILNIEK